MHWKKILTNLFLVCIIVFIAWFFVFYQRRWGWKNYHNDTIGVTFQHPSFLEVEIEHELTISEIWREEYKLISSFEIYFSNPDNKKDMNISFSVDKFADTESANDYTEKLVTNKTYNIVENNLGEQWIKAETPNVNAYYKSKENFVYSLLVYRALTTRADVFSDISEHVFQSLEVQ